MLRGLTTAPTFGQEGARSLAKTLAMTSDPHTPSEVAELFRVNPETVERWARTGKIAAIRTLGAHRRDAR